MQNNIKLCPITIVSISNALTRCLKASRAFSEVAEAIVGAVGDSVAVDELHGHKNNTYYPLFREARSSLWHRADSGKTGAAFGRNKG
jgi:hypothetical protein